MHIVLGDNEYGSMIGNTINFHDHLNDVAEADDLLKQHVGPIFPLEEICRIEIINIVVQQQIMLASALQEMRKARYVSVLADEVTSRKTSIKALLDFLLCFSGERMCQNDSQKMESSTSAVHTCVDFYFIVTFTLEEDYGVNFEYQC